jgi:hypothetical protein
VRRRVAIRILRTKRRIRYTGSRIKVRNREGHRITFEGKVLERGRRLSGRKWMKILGRRIK